MKNLISFLFAFLLISFVVKAETKQIVLCSDYDKSTGVPSGINKNWNIAAGGSYVYVIYSQDKTIKEDLSLYVDKKNDNGSYVAYGTYYFNNDIKSDAKKWAMYDLKFTEIGDYKISVMGKSTDALATTYTNINWIKGEDINAANMKKAKKETDIVDTDYYMDSEIVFGESVSNNGTVSGEATTFRLVNGTKEFTAKVSQDEPLKLTQIYVSVYTGDTYGELVSDVYYDVADKDWNYVTVPIKVTKKGKYVVDMYTQDDVFINSGYFEIK